MPTITEGYLEHPVFKLVSETARELGVRAFVIGGYVRDCFLGRPNKDIDIVETGLRPGEKLYEELLVKSEELDKTENNLIYIEKDVSLSDAELEEKLAVLRDAVESGSDEEARHALMSVVPTYHTPAEVNGAYDKEKETADK